MAQRIRGQEVEVLLVVDGQVQDTITDIRSFDFTFELETQDEGYLGETTNRKDSIFNGVSGSLEFHFENDDFLDLYGAIVDKARRRTPGVRINIKATLNFSNGDRPRIIIPDVEFGNLPLSFGGRSEYGSGSIDYVASEARVIT